MRGRLRRHRDAAAVPGRVPRRREKIRTFPLPEISPDPETRRRPPRQHPERRGEVGLPPEDPEPAVVHPPRHRRVESRRRHREEHLAVDHAEIGSRRDSRQHRGCRAARVVRQSQRARKIVPPARRQHRPSRRRCGPARTRPRSACRRRPPPARSPLPVPLRPGPARARAPAPSSAAAPPRLPWPRSAPPRHAPRRRPARGPPPDWRSRRPSLQRNPHSQR